jgi:hypothetical protein
MLYLLISLVAVVITIGIAVVIYGIYHAIKDSIKTTYKMYGMIIITLLLVLSSCSVTKPADMSFNKRTVNNVKVVPHKIHYCNR